MGLRENLKMTKKMISQKRNLYNDISDRKTATGLKEKMKIHREVFALYKNSL